MFFPVTSPHCQCPFHNLMEKGVLTVLIYSISYIFGGMSTIGASVPNVELCLLLFFGKCLLHMCRHKNIYNIGVES